MMSRRLGAKLWRVEAEEKERLRRRTISDLRQTRVPSGGQGVAQQQ